MEWTAIADSWAAMANRLGNDTTLDIPEATTPPDRVQGRALVPVGTQSRALVTRTPARPSNP